MNIKATAGVVSILAGVGILFAQPANATPGPDHKEWILHPVAGQGELKNGYNCISPDKASSHFDENGNPKHEAEGRVDKYDTEGLCTKSDPTTSTVTTSSTTTAPTSSTTTTTIPTTSTTTPTSSPTSTVTSTPSTTTTTTTTTTRTATVPPITHSTTTSPRKDPAGLPNWKAEPQPELAYTGFNYVQFTVALALILAGIIIILTARKIEVIKNV